MMLTFNHFPTLTELKTVNPLRLVCFDMDGTLFNTEMIHAQALLELGKLLKIKLNLPLSEIEKTFHGKADEQVYQELEKLGHKPSISVAEFIHKKNELILEILKKFDSHNYFHASLRSLLSELKHHNIKLAVVTSSEREVMEALLIHSQTHSFFDFTMTRNEAKKIKPDPWPYTETMKILNITPAETFIFEDSNVGLEAAMKSGASVGKVLWWK